MFFFCAFFFFFAGMTIILLQFLFLPSYSVFLAMATSRNTQLHSHLKQAILSGDFKRAKAHFFPLHGGVQRAGRAVTVCFTNIRVAASLCILVTRLGVMWGTSPQAGLT